MKYIIVSLLLSCLLAGCASARRSEGEPYPSYSCRESLMHFYSRCSSEKITKEEFNAKVQVCEKELATKVCDKEQADLLWCMGRVEPGIYTSGGGVGIPVGRGVVVSRGQNITKKGCDCFTFEGELKNVGCKREYLNKFQGGY